MPIQIKRNIYAFGKKFLVVCPQCSKQATLNKRDKVAKPNVVLTCSHCGCARQWQQTFNDIQLGESWQWVSSEHGAIAGVPAPAGYNGSLVSVWVETSPDITQQSEGHEFRLWLQTSCDDENLWCFNHEQLAFVETYVQASPESRSRLFSRKLQWLPNWVKQAEQREIVLKCLEDLRLQS